MEGARDDALILRWHGGMAEEQFKPPVAVEVGDGKTRLSGIHIQQIGLRQLSLVPEGDEFVLPEIPGIGNRLDLCLLRSGHRRDNS